MKIFLDNNFNIIKTEGSNVFGKGNNLNDRVIVIMPNDSIKQNALPLFKFKLASGRTLGAFNCSEVSYQYDENNTAYPFVLTNTILSVKGELEITIEVKLFNENLTPIRTKNVTAKAIVVDNIVLNDDILIIGNEGEIIESVRANVESLNARATQLENTLVNNETIDVDRVNGIIYGNNFYPKKSNASLGNEYNRFSSAYAHFIYADFIVDNNDVIHDSKNILDSNNVNYNQSPVINPNSILIGYFMFNNKRIDIYIPTDLISAPEKTTGKFYLVGVENQYANSNSYSNSKIYVEDNTVVSPKVITEQVTTSDVNTDYINGVEFDNIVKLENGKIPASQLPSYVDDVIDVQIDPTSDYKKAYKVNYSTGGAFTIGELVTPEHNKIYSNVDSKIYRWSGSSYVEISSSLALGETSSTAFAGDRGKALENQIGDIARILKYINDGVM